MSFILILIFSFLAGFIDSIIGGGGLIQIPALLVLFPSFPIPTLFGTNKFSSISGTGMAIINYNRTVEYPKRYLIDGAITAFIFSALGAFLTTFLPSSILRPIVIVLLISIFIYTLVNKDFGKDSDKIFVKNTYFLIIFTAIIGFYDGFFGPGTGSFLIFCFVYFMNLNFLQASASAKIINFSTNLSALIYFISTGHILWYLAIPMAISNSFGSFVGTKLAIKFGHSFIRILFITIVSILILKLLYDQFKFIFI
jgi:hypothetical protein